MPYFVYVASLQLCRLFFSYTLDCLQTRLLHYVQLCEENMHSYEMNEYIGCAFFKEVVQQCGNNSYVWNTWRFVTSCGRCSLNECFTYLMIDLWLPACMGKCRETDLSRRPGLCRTGCCLCLQLLQPESQIVRPGSHQLLCLPIRLALSDCMLLTYLTLLCECFFSLQEHSNKRLP